MTAPITPDDVDDLKAQAIPAGVIEAVNELIVARWDGHSSRITLAEIVARLSDEFTSRELLDNRWLDFEHLFRSSGWKVVWDKPGFNEEYDANWIFTK